MTHARLRLAAVVAVMAALVVAAGLVPPSMNTAATPVQATRVLLERATLACPESGFARGSVATDVGAVAAPADPTADGFTALPTHGDAPASSVAPRLALTALGETKARTAGERRERLVSYAVRKAKTPPLVISAQGDVAPGVAASQITRGARGSQRGLAEVACQSAGSEFWFVGTGSQLGRHGRVYLTNTDSAVARVDLRLFDESGPVESEGTRGLVVAPHKQIVVELDKLAPTSQRLAASVVTKRGRVVAALRDDAVDGETPIGIDSIPAATRPAKDILVPGVAPGAGRRVLTIVAPEDATAGVELSILAPGGTFRPVELGHVEVKPGSVREVRLDTATNKQAAAVRLTSDVPVTASVRTELGTADGVRDVAYTSALRSLSGPAIVPVTSAGPGRKATLLLSTPSRRAVHASAALVATNGRALGSTKVVIKPGSTVALDLKPPKGQQRYTVVVRSDDGGPLYGARLLVESPKGESGPMVSAFPLTSAVVTAIRPVSRADHGAGIGVERPSGGVFD
jgi:hypothetical protein